MAGTYYVKDLKADERLLSAATECAQIARDVGWQHFIDGFATTRELAEFATRVRTAIPSIKFFPNSSGTYEFKDMNGKAHYLRVLAELHAYTDEYPVTLGTIGFMDYQVGKAKLSYGVYSRKITNTKYRPYRDQFHMTTTNTVEKAVKNACAYLVPYTHVELMEIFYPQIQAYVSQALHKTKNALTEALSDVSRGGFVLEEVLHLKSLGVEFKTAGFREFAEKVTNLVEAQQEEMSRRVSGVFVRLRKVGDVTYADMSEATDMRKHFNVRLDASKWMDVTTCSVDDLPSDVAGALSVLSILEDKQYVERVGQRIDERTYWIERG